jgi:hypothetical protein
MGSMCQIVQKAQTTEYLPWGAHEKLYAPNDVKPPHLLFSKQQVKVSKSAQRQLGYKPNLLDNTYINDWKTWCDLAEFGVMHELISDEVCKAFLDAPMNSNFQGESLINLTKTCLDSLGSHLESVTSRYIKDINECGMTVSEHMVKYCRSNFSFSITMHLQNGNNDYIYGDEDATSGLRLDAQKGLNVISIDCLKNAPITLKNVAGMLLNRIVFMGNKCLSCDIVEIHSDMEGLNEYVEHIKKKDWVEIQSLIDEIQEPEVIINCFKKHGVDFEELLEYWEEDELISRLSNINMYQYDYLTKNRSQQHDHDLTITQVNKSLDYIRDSSNPIVAHPLYTHLRKLTGVLEKLYQHVETAELEQSGSHHSLGEFSVVAVDLDEENEWLESHNRYLSDNGEAGSNILNMSHPDIVKHLENHLLADLLLCSFDLDLEVN